MDGSGKFEWLDLDGNRHLSTNWDEIPAKIMAVISFQPDLPEPPHTKEQHDYIDTFNGKLQEILTRCLR